MRLDEILAKDTYEAHPGSHGWYVQNMTTNKVVVDNLKQEDAEKMAASLNGDEE